MPAYTQELASLAPVLHATPRYWQWRHDFLEYWRQQHNSVYLELQGCSASPELGPDAMRNLAQFAHDAVLMALDPPVRDEVHHLLYEPATGYDLLQRLDRALGHPLDVRACHELEALQQCNLQPNETFANFRGRLRQNIQWLEMYGYAMGEDHKFLHLHRQFTPYHPELCETYLARFVDIIKHRKRLDHWNEKVAAHELELWKRTERELTMLLSDFITAIDRNEHAANSRLSAFETPSETPVLEPVSRAMDQASLPDPDSRPPIPQDDTNSVHPPVYARAPTPTTLPVEAPPPPTVQSEGLPPTSSVTTAPPPSTDEHRSLRVALLATAEHNDTSYDPSRPSVHQAVSGSNSNTWLGLIKAEMRRLEQMQSWELVDWAAPDQTTVRETQSLLTPQFIFKASLGRGNEVLSQQVHLGVREQAPMGGLSLMSLRTMMAAYCQKRS